MNYKDSVSKEYKRTKRIKTINSVKEVVLSLLFMVCLFIFIPGIAGGMETHYKMEGVVKEVSEKTTLLQDKSGNEWVVEDCSFKKGDKVIITFFTNYTDSNREDDEIVNVEKVKE